ncbi:MAG TPA: chromate efflux transporter [Actinomycetota bacterium]|nr:chromate efflux transporter [Actinomycetota bacterium]
MTRGSPAVGRAAETAHLVPLRDALRWWTKLGFVNFGGPAGQIAIMHDELVVRKRWISERRFLHALNYCMLLPGPEAQQLAIYIGWLLNGNVGGIAAGVLFVAPAFFLILGLSWTYAVYGDVSWVAAVFYGLQAAVIALVAAAVLRIGAKAVRTPLMAAIAGAAFVGIFLLKMPFPLIILAAGVAGVVAARVAPEMLVRGTHDDVEDDAVLGDAEIERRSRRSGRQTLRVVAIGLFVWWAPLIGVIFARGTHDTLTRAALFFSQAAMVTFGGAYAVLAYINQAAVHDFGWLEPGQMVTGLGLAESTPGPLIMVTEFVGFLAAYRFPGGLDPVIAGIAGAAVAVWATFAPCFLWIFLGAPYIERLRENRTVGAALAGVTAAVVGVILNLGVTFGLAVLFRSVTRGNVLGMTYPRPEWNTVDLFLTGLAVAGFVALWRLRLNVLWVVGASAAFGLVWRLTLLGSA